MIDRNIYERDLIHHGEFRLSLTDIERTRALRGFLKILKEEINKIERIETDVSNEKLREKTIFEAVKHEIRVREKHALISDLNTQ
jgi:hypothetical protein